MKCGARVAGALATGYVLGRSKKMKLALMMASWAAGQKFGSPADLITKGTEVITKSPEFARLNDEVRTKLLDAGKAAVTAAATQRLTTLTDSVADSVGTNAERFAKGEKLVPKRSAKKGKASEDDTDSAADGDDEKPGKRSLLRFRRRGAAKSEEVDETEDSAEVEEEPAAEAEEPAEEEPAAEAEEPAEVEEEPAAEAEEPAPEPEKKPAPKRRKPAAAAERSSTTTRTARKTGTRTAAAARRTTSAAKGGRTTTARATSGGRGNARTGGDNG